MLHQLTNEEFQDLMNKRQAAENEAAVLRAELATEREATLRISRGADSAAELLKLVHASIRITQFAVANLPPETTRGWPTDTLREISEGIRALPECSMNERDLANEFLGFIREVEVMEDRRRRGVIGSNATTGT